MNSDNPGKLEYFSLLCSGGYHVQHQMDWFVKSCDTSSRDVFVVGIREYSVPELGILTNYVVQKCPIEYCVTVVLLNS